MRITISMNAKILASTLFIAPFLLSACAASPSAAGADPGGSIGGGGTGADGSSNANTGSGNGNGGKDGASGAVGGNGAFLTTGNPFAGAVFYVNPDYAAEVQGAIASAPANTDALAKIKNISTAIWLDTLAKVPTVGKYLDDALAQQTKLQKPVVTQFVIYDLPGRDCHANASNGELSLSAADVQRYKTDYIDKIAAAFAAHPNQRIAAIVEPDSLPNLATNMSDPRCAASDAIYRDGVAYAIRTLSAPNVYLYLDTGHSGWLGWPDNITKATAIFSQVLTAAGGANKIRGFASNTANYSVLHETQEQFDYQFNPCHDELTFAQHLTSALAAAGIPDKHFLIDTSRNGRGGIRRQWGSWCNVQGAAIGERPTADPAPGIDAYTWIKPPGESDGTADPTAARFDLACGSGNPDATPGAPQAGQWFNSYFLMLAGNATPPL